MENLSPIALPVTIEIHPYLRDHRFDGRAVFPAVETMQLLARAAGNRLGDTALHRITQARFDKFLPVPDKAEQVEVLVDLGPPEKGRIEARLKTRIKAGKSAMTRVKTHGRIRVSALAGQAPGPVPQDLEPQPFREGFGVDPQRIYAELVPFGPSYRNICEPLRLAPDGTAARIRAPHLPADEQPLGSPFVLDAAFHAACVWGQRYANVVAFPVALERRSVWRPTRAGETYTAVVLPGKVDAERLIFDLRIFDGKQRICETVDGVEMRDVSGGRWKPPAWIGVGKR